MISRGEIVRVSGEMTDGLFLVTLRLPRFDTQVFWTRSPWMAALCEGYRGTHERVSLTWDDNHKITAMGLPVAESKEQTC